MRRKHIQHFHRAAYRWYCLHHETGRFNPVRCLIAAVLAARAAALIVSDSLRPGPGAGDRPEGGVAV